MKVIALNLNLNYMTTTLPVLNIIIYYLRLADLVTMVTVANYERQDLYVGILTLARG